MTCGPSGREQARASTEVVADVPTGEERRMQTIRNPGEVTAEALGAASRHLGQIASAVSGSETELARTPPRARRITTDDLRAALSEGWEDFKESRSDLMAMCIAYPLAGLAAAGLATNANLLPLLFPAIAGLALVGPAAAVGLYEMSRRREQGRDVDWTDAFGVLGSPSFGAIFLLAAMIGALFLVWMGAAQTIYALTLGPEPPASLGAFVSAVLGTGAGWAMIVIGFSVGFLFAAAALATSIVSFPLLLDRQVGLVRAVLTSVDVARTNPRETALWGLIVAGTLVAACVPLFLGLIVAIPVLGHATWRLYRRAVV
jgi:uncharacterized membrane protein